MVFKCERNHTKQLLYINICATKIRFRASRMLVVDDDVVLCGCFFWPFVTTELNVQQ